MSRVLAITPKIEVAAGFPAARVQACIRRAGQLIDCVKDRGEIVGVVEITANGTTRVLTPAGLAVLAPDNGAWD